MLPEYKTILLAIDLSENSAYALRHAVAIGRCHNAKVHLLHVLPDVEPAVLNYVATVMGEGRLADYELQHKEDIRDKVRVSVHQFAKSELLNNPEYLALIDDIEVHHGNPASVVLDVAERLDADLIVIGSHGKGRVSHAFLGSMAKRLLRKSVRPVLVIPLQD
ncbi:MAG: universal stress protein [Deltaproteobacteria bacterium]|nr:universal stress protein [Deltaproteobacteria bacterium]